jgi:hypothetical protein
MAEGLTLDAGREEGLAVVVGILRDLRIRLFALLESPKPSGFSPC